MATEDNYYQHEQENKEDLCQLRKHPSVVPEDRHIDFGAIGGKAEVEQIVPASNLGYGMFDLFKRNQ